MQTHTYIHIHIQRSNHGKYCCDVGINMLNILFDA